MPTAEDRAKKLVYEYPELDALMDRAALRRREREELKAQLFHQIANEIRDAETRAGATRTRNERESNR